MLQQQYLEKMLPYFFVAGHNHSRYISWHLRDMQHIPLDANQDLLNGSHVCRHTEGAAAASGDQYGEQTYVYQTGKPSRGTEGHIDQPWTIRRLDLVDRCLFSPCNGNGRRRHQQVGTRLRWYAPHFYKAAEAFIPTDTPVWLTVQHRERTSGLWNGSTCVHYIKE